ncbi:hypothetical protein AAFF_G00153010 [Aldrovandia affinis]|uniref:PHD-type domain-containing protein n=1 Tax=Aldrovandia affinis TaxID=143900 RepID=A0AAD7RP01_9TELE|nr:hypothetical protein AAFF_G00153010 [Aldrovandia affinis]
MGTSGKCKRTVNKWLTPAEFVKKDPAHGDSWRKSILCQGVPLSDLIKGKQEQENDDHCSVCHKLGSLVCCDQCPRAFHSGCHLPTVDENILGEKWHCTYCILAESQQWKYACNRSLTQAVDSCISDFMLECQYLLLKLYSSDEQHIFGPNPCASVPLYGKAILSLDVRLIFDNCFIFNKDNEFGQMGARLKELFEREFQHVFSVQQ